MSGHSPDATAVSNPVAAAIADGAVAGIVPQRQVDTHAAHVFLTADRAWKLKRRVHYPYLDFSTPERRREALQAELTLNRRTAPELYLALHPVVRRPDGSFALGDGKGADGAKGTDGTGCEVVDWLLEMRRFADDALFDLRARHRLLTPALILDLADRIADLHAHATPVVSSGAERMRAILDGNRASFAAVADILDPQSTARLEALQRAELETRAEHLDARARAGRVRRGHGDLHLRNIALVDGRPLLFDCLEFDETLATTDVLYDLAFLVMDLWHRGLMTEANMLANRYLDVAPQGGRGYALLPLFLSIRAAIRAHVLAMNAQRGGDAELAGEARGYLALAEEALIPAPPRLVAIGGLSGTGKTTLARMLAAPLGRMPGARILRSDVFRKRLAGMSPETRLPPSAYTAHSAADTYEALFISADSHLGCGTAVVLDAVFALRSERDVAEALGHRDHVPFTGIWLEAPEQERIARVNTRSSDASDATPAVVHEQSRKSVGELGGWHRIRTNRPIDQIATAARRALGRHRR